MSFRESIGLSIDSSEEELHFNRELIEAKGLLNYKVKDLKEGLKGDVSTEEEEKIAYMIYSDVKTISDKQVWGDVKFDIFLMFPGFYGGEFTKTSGHYRTIADNGYHFPEVYQVVEGYAEFLLQQNTTKHEQVKDVMLYRCQKDDLIIVPPSSGVTIINPSERKTIIGRIRARDAEDITEPFVKTKGACYYREKQDKWDYNPHYEEIPNLRLEPPRSKWLIMQRGIPIYTVFVNNPGMARLFVEPTPTEFTT